VISSTVTQERAVTEAEVLYERRIPYLDVDSRREIRRARGFCICVSADKALVSFSDDPSFTASTFFTYFIKFKPSLEKGRGNTLENAGFDDCTHYGVHAGAVAARREDSELHSFVMNFLQDPASLYTRN
jgi:hypothetical protein